jgi:ABC-2 type transport system permease protein
MNPTNPESNGLPDSPRASRVNPQQGVGWGRVLDKAPLYWSVRRELWENRSVYMAPAGVAAVFLVGFLLSAVHLARRMRGVLALDSMHQVEVIGEPYHIAETLIMGTMFIVAIFYCLDALYGERRDRSILFWKSLPVSDLTTVLSKASIPLVVLPLLTFVVTAATQLLMLLISSAVLLGSGAQAAVLWANLPLFQMWIGLFFHLLAIHGLYYAPFYGWMILVSGWARRAPFLWATLPVFAMCMVEKIAFNTWHVAHMLGDRVMGGGASGVSYGEPASAMMHPLTILNVGKFLVSPGLWIGLALFTAFIVAAVRLRRSEGPI